MYEPTRKIMIAHTARSGSNWLSEMLSSTGVCGFAEWFHGHYMAGVGERLPLDFEANDRAYWQKMCTANGVSASKIGWGYITKQLSHWLGPRAVHEWMMGIDNWIHLARRDKVAQAVSLYIANHTKAFTSIEAEKRGTGAVPIYNYYKIDELHCEIEQEDFRWWQWFARNDVPVMAVYYEDLVEDAEGWVKDILRWLDLPADNPITYHLKKQGTDINQHYAELYRSGVYYETNTD